MSYSKFIILVIGCVCTFALGDTIRTEQTRQIMRNVFLSLDRILPLSIRMSDFTDPENAKIISNEITNLKINSYLLGKHVATSTVNNKLTADNLIADFYLLDEYYENKQYDEARFVLHSLTENCTNCHTRMGIKNGATPGLSVHFAKDTKKDLNGLDLAHFNVMGRRFDEAIALYEAEFRKDPTLLDSENFYDYLKVALRVKMDPKRVANLLDYMVPKVEKDRDIGKVGVAWRNSLKDIPDLSLPKNQTVATAEKLMEKANAIKSYPKDETGMIYLISASAILHSVLDTQKMNKDQLAEVYFLLGQTEGYISLSCWMREYDQYYEHSIRSAPASKWAERSLAALKTEYRADYSGSSGTNVPGDIQIKLRELNDLIVQSKNSKKGPRL